MKKKEANKKEITNVKKTKSNKGQIIAIIIVTILLVCLLFHSIFSLITKNESTYIVRYGNISKEEDLSGLVIREENVVTVPEDVSSESLQRIITEGKRIAEGENVYKFYTNDETDIHKQINEHHY